MVPLGLLLGSALWERRTPIDEAVPTSVAAVVSLVPEGLILLASLTYAVAALRMARRGALVQQLNARRVARVGRPRLPRQDGHADRQQPSSGRRRSRRRRGSAFRPGAVRSERGGAERHAAGDRRRGRRGAGAGGGDACPSRPAGAGAACGWTGVDFVLGAPELFELGDLEERAADEAARRAPGGGVRDQPVALEEIDPDEPPTFALRGLVVISERLRPEARATVEYFRREGVALLVISGDRPETVAAIARDAGIPVADTLDGRELPAGSGRAAASPRRRVGDRAHLAGRQAAGRGGPGGRRPLRRDGRGRRERRPGSQGLAPRHRPGSGDADGQERRRSRPGARRLRRGPGDGAGGSADPSEPPAGRAALRHEVGLRGVPDPLDRADAHGLPAASAPPDAGGDAHDRHPVLLPRPGAEPRAVPGADLPPGRVELLAARRRRRRTRCRLQLPLRPARPRPAAPRGEDGRHDRADHDRAVLRPRARGVGAPSRPGGVGARGRARRGLWARAACGRGRASSSPCRR